MRHGEPPGCVIYPSPAPGIDPGPMTVAIRSPVGGHACRRPHVAVVPIGAPSAVRIKVLIADHFARHITCGRRILAAAIAVASPVVQIVVVPRCEGLIVREAGAVEAISLLRIDRIRSTVAVHFGLAPLHRDRRCVVIRIDIDPVFAGMTQRKSEIGRIDLEGLVRCQSAYPYFQRAFRKLHLCDVIVEIEQGHTGGRP